MKQKLLVLIFIICAVNQVSAQNGVNVNVNTSGIFGLEYSFTPMISGVLRFQSGEFGAERLTPMVLFNLKETDDAIFYIGAGLRGLDPVETISVPLGVRVFPFTEMNRFAFTLELDNHFDDNYYLRPSIGFLYRFGE